MVEEKNRLKNGIFSPRGVETLFLLAVRNAKGQSLVSTIISAGIMMILALSMASLLSSQSQEIAHLRDKMAQISLQNLLMAALSDGSVCLYAVNNPTVKTFNSASTQTLSSSSITVASLPASYSPATGPGPAVVTAGSKASVESETLWVLPQAAKGIQLTNFTGSSGNYTAEWVISFDSTKLKRPLRPIRIPVKLTADTTVPSNSKITGCMAGGMGQNNCAWTPFTGTYNTSGNPGASLCPVGKYVAGMNCNWMDTAGSNADQCQAYCCNP